MRAFLIRGPRASCLRVQRKCGHTITNKSKDNGHHILSPWGQALRRALHSRQEAASRLPSAPFSRQETEVPAPSASQLSPWGGRAWAPTDLRWMKTPIPPSTRSKTTPATTPPITAMLPDPSVAVRENQLMSREPFPLLTPNHGNAPFAPKAPFRDPRCVLDAFTCDGS